MRFVEFLSTAAPRLEVHINPEEVAAIRGNFGKAMFILRSGSATEPLTGAAANVVAGRVRETR